MTTETLSDLQTFSRVRVTGARNIASHDYERVNFEIIYDICKMLICEKVTNELREVIRNADSDKE